MKALLLLALSGPAWAAPELDALYAATHMGHVDGERVRWTSHLEFQRGGEVRFAWPLSSEDALTRLNGAEPLLDAQGRVEGLQVYGARPVQLEVEGPLRAELLQPPLVLDSDAPQRVSLDEAWFRAGPESGLTWGMAHQTAPELNARDRRLADRVSEGDKRRLGSQPLYLVADARLASMGGVPGELRQAGEVPAQTAMAIGGLFALALAALVGVVRALGALSRKEQVERYIRSELGVSREGA